MENPANNYIAVSYELYITEDGKKSLVEKAPTERPFRFISGMGTTLDYFENRLADLKSGEKFDFTIPVAEAYGEHDNAYVMDLPRNVFEIDGKFDSDRIYEGNVVPMINSDGTRMQATVVTVKADTVVMDFNHPLAGKDLNFKGEVLENRPATNEEIQRMLNMLSGEGGCGGCGGSCGGGDCGGGSCSGDGGDCGGGCGGCH